MTDVFDETLVRDLVPQVIGVLVRRGADFAADEDAVQDALVAALDAWPTDPPRDPKAWLVTAAWRKVLDAIRSDAARAARELRVDAEPTPGTVAGRDDTLELYLRCAHPSLTPASAVALTLRAVGGLTTRQIAEAYLVPEATVAQRINRAKRTVSGASLDEPGSLVTVLRVLYLVFNEGYSGDVDLSAAAIRLARRLHAVTGHEAAAGLLALMLLHHARRRARTRSDGSLVPLAAQDRSLWDTGLVAEGVTILQWRSPVTGWASTRHRRRSRRCAATRAAPRRPIGCRSSSGTTSSWRSRTPLCTGWTGRWPSARLTAHRRAWRRWSSWTRSCRATPPSLPTCTRRTGTFPAPPTSTPRRPAGPPTFRSAIISPGRQHGSVRPLIERGASVDGRRPRSDLFDPALPPRYRMPHRSRGILTRSSTCAIWIA